MAGKTKWIALPHCGEILQSEFLEPFGISQSELARAIAVPRARISELVNGKRAMTADTDLRLGRYFGLSQGYFLHMQERLDILNAARALEKTLARIKPHDAVVMA